MNKYKGLRKENPFEGRVDVFLTCSVTLGVATDVLWTERVWL